MWLVCILTIIFATIQVSLIRSCRTKRMRTKLFSAIFLTVAVFFLFSCGEDPYDGSGTFYGTSISSSQTSLYAKAGEIQDPSVIDRFVRIHGEFEPDLDILLSAYKYQASYVDDTTVVVTSLASGSQETMTVIDRDSVVIWEGRDTVRQYTQHLGAFKYKRLHYTEVMDEDSNVLITNFLNCMYVIPSGPDLLMPITFYYHKKGSGSSISERKGKGNNEFNLGYLAGFGDTDTVLVYRYNLRLRKQ